MSKRPASGEWSISADRRITRRKLFHLVICPQGTIAFRDRTLGACIRWLDAEGIEAYWLHSPDADGLSLHCKATRRKEH